MASGSGLFLAGAVSWARRCRRPAGAFWAAALLLIGLLLSDREILASNPVTSLFVLLGRDLQVVRGLCLCLAITAILGSQLVFMVLIADEACPDAPMVVTGPLKLAAGLLAWGALVATMMTLLRPFGTS